MATTAGKHSGRINRMIRNGQDMGEIVEALGNAIEDKAKVDYSEYDLSEEHHEVFGAYRIDGFTYADGSVMLYCDDGAWPRRAWVATTAQRKLLEAYS